MVPRFEKRVRSYAADVSGLAILTILTALGMPVFPGREYAQAAVMLVGFPNYYTTYDFIKRSNFR